MLHVALRWPEAYDPILWPMAMEYAIDLYNELPCNGGRYCPEEVFSQAVSSHSRLLNGHPWGCPVYVLELKLHEAGGKLPKWQPKTRCGQFLGFSPVHLSTVGLIQNLCTGSITPQFHCVYDSEFETVVAPDGKLPSKWHELVMDHRYQTPLDDDCHVVLPDEWLTPEEIAAKRDAERLQSKSTPPPALPPTAPKPPSTPLVRQSPPLHHTH